MTGTHTNTHKKKERKNSQKINIEAWSHYNWCIMCDLQVMLHPCLDEQNILSTHPGFSQNISEIICIYGVNDDTYTICAPKGLAQVKAD